ncbi:MAG: hypothetical protein U5K84_10375 [Alkalibacterium sp.]|nr:hypothetical protein [Alkalibacterium sp.]
MSDGRISVQLIERFSSQAHARIRRTFELSIGQSFQLVSDDLP